MSETEAEEPRVVIAMEDRRGKAPIYANHAMVDVSPFEATTGFGWLDPAARREAATEGGEIRIEAVTVARITLPHAMFRMLCEAMREMIEQVPQLQQTGREAGV